MIIKFQDLISGEDAYKIELLPSQEKFWRDTSRYILMSGGLGSGKSIIMLLRVIYDAMRQDNNYILVGRATYQEIHDVMIKEFFEICHPTWVKEYRKSPHPTVVLNTFGGKTSEIIFRNLDKMSKSELLGLNLGGFAIDQAEDIDEEIFLTLKGRLRRKNIDHRVYMTSNPKLSWLYHAFVIEPEDNYSLIQVSTLENVKNLPEEYVKDLSNYPKSWYKQYVLGVWDESLLSDNVVLAREHIETFIKGIRPSIREKEGLKIYRSFDKTHRYQIGIDCAEGIDTSEDILRRKLKDSAVITIWDHTTDELAAQYSGRIPPRVTAEKAVLFASWFGNPLIVPEMNSIGFALLDKLQDLGYDNIYRRKEYDRVLKKNLKKLGFRTTSSTKQLLISHFEELCRLRKPQLYSKETVEEWKTFVYSDDARKKGAGAQSGFHDDRVMSTMLAAFDEEPVIAAALTKGKEKHTIINDSELTPSVTLVNGRYRPPKIFQEKSVSWKLL